MDWIEHYRHIKNNLMLAEKLMRLKKHSGVAPKLFPPSPHAPEPLLRRSRFLFLHNGKKGFQDAFMANVADAPELVAGPSQFLLPEQGIRSLTCMMRRFEGRTWHGFHHHHLALAAMAHYVAGTSHRSGKSPAK